MWLSNSSIGRKVVMSVTGIALVLSHYLCFLADDDEPRSSRK